MMLERALKAVENASSEGGVYPEVMFEVGRQWYYLFEKNAQPNAATNGGSRHHPPSIARQEQFNPAAAPPGAFSRVFILRNTFLSFYAQKPSRVFILFETI